MGVEVAVALTVLSLGVGIDQANKAEAVQGRAFSAQKKQARIASASEKIRLKQSRRQQIREERVRRAQIEQAAENTGLSGSSIESNAISNLSSRVAGNLAAQSSGTRAAESITNIGEEIAGFRARASKSGARSGLAFNVFQQASSFGIQKHFAGNK